MLAATKGRAEVVKLLVAAGADVFAQTRVSGGALVLFSSVAASAYVRKPMWDTVGWEHGTDKGIPGWPRSGNEAADECGG
jgi:hypothetical protein